MAEFGREHEGQIGQAWTKNGWLPRAIREYNQKIETYKNDLIAGRKMHTYRDPSGKALHQEPNLNHVNSLNRFYLRSKIMLYLVLQRGPGKIKKRLMRFIRN